MRTVDELGAHDGHCVSHPLLRRLATCLESDGREGGQVDEDRVVGGLLAIATTED